MPEVSGLECAHYFSFPATEVWEICAKKCVNKLPLPQYSESPYLKVFENKYFLSILSVTSFHFPEQDKLQFSNESIIFVCMQIQTARTFCRLLGSIISFCNLKGILSILKCMVKPQYKSQEIAWEFELLLEITCGEPVHARRNILGSNKGNGREHKCAIYCS